MAIGRKPRIGSTRTLEFVGGNVAFLPLGIASITGDAIRRVLEHAVPAITRDLAENAAKVAAANARQLDLVHTEEFAEGFVVGKIRMGHEVANETEYAGVIELGRTPGKAKPPHGPVKEWVRAKIGPPEDELDAVTHAVRNKIKMNPMGPKPVLLRAAKDPTTRLRVRVAASKHIAAAFAGKAKG